MPGLCKTQTHPTATQQKASPSHSTYPFWPTCVTLRSVPYFFLIHLIPCCWGSISRGQRSQCVRIAAFSVDILSLGSPSLFQVAMVASSVNMAIKSRPSVIGMETLNIRVEGNQLPVLQSKKLSTTDKTPTGQGQDNTCQCSLRSRKPNATLIVKYNLTRQARHLALRILSNAVLNIWFITASDFK